MESAQIGQRVKYVSPDTGETYFGKVKSTQIIDSEYIPNYQRAEVEIDAYIAKSYVFTLLECNTRFLDYA